MSAVRLTDTARRGAAGKLDARGPVADPRAERVSAEIAALLDCSEKTVQRDWNFAKAWISRELQREP